MRPDCTLPRVVSQLGFVPGRDRCHLGSAAQSLQLDDQFVEPFRIPQQEPVGAVGPGVPRVRAAAGQLDFSAVPFQQALQLDLSNSRVHASLGSVKEKMGDLSQALANYQRSYSLNTFQPDLPTRIASLQQRVGSAPATNLSPTGTGQLRSAGAAGFQTNRNY